MVGTPPAAGRRPGPPAQGLGKVRACVVGDGWVSGPGGSGGQARLLGIMWIQARSFLLRALRSEELGEDRGEDLSGDVVEAAGDGVAVRGRQGLAGRLRRGAKVLGAGIAVEHQRGRTHRASPRGPQRPIPGDGAVVGQGVRDRLQARPLRCLAQSSDGLGRQADAGQELLDRLAPAACRDELAALGVPPGRWTPGLCGQG
jgi:hypothetical protein